MADKTLVERLVADPARMRGFQQERAIFEVTDLIEELMEQLGVSRAGLAAKLGKTRGWVTQLLDGEANKTVRTVADVCAVLGHEFHATACSIQIGVSTPNATITGVASLAGQSTQRIRSDDSPKILRFPSQTDENWRVEPDKAAAQ